MKKFLIFTLSLVFMFIVFSACDKNQLKTENNATPTSESQSDSQNKEIPVFNGFYYQEIGSKVILTGYNRPDDFAGDVLEIPSEINEKPVIGIGYKYHSNYTLFNIDGIHEIIIPDSVTYIGEDTFLLKPELQKVRGGNGVKEVGYSAFSNDANLAEVEFLDTVEWFHSSAFNETGLLKEHLAELRLSKQMDEKSFVLDMDFQQERFDENHCGPYTIASQGENISILSLYGSHLPYSKVILPESIDDKAVVCVGEHGSPQNVIFGVDFVEAAELVVPDSVVIIGTNALSNETVKTVSGGSSVKVIANNAFKDCKELVSVSFYKTAPFKSVNAFDGCEKFVAD